MLVAKPKRMSKSTDPTNGVDTYPDSSSARVNNQRRSVPVDPISKTTTPLPIGSISLSSHVTRSGALHRHRRTNREPTENYLAPKNPVESISSRLSSASQRGIEAEPPRSEGEVPGMWGESVRIRPIGQLGANHRTCHGIGSGSRSCTAGRITRPHIINNCHMPECDDVRKLASNMRTPSLASLHAPRC
jgi:hypothetical protein